MSVSVIDENMPLQRAQDALAAPVEDRLLMLSVSQGSYFEFSPVMRRIWELLDTPLTVTELTTALVAEYEVDRETCYKEVLPAIQELIAEGLLSDA